MHEFEWDAAVGRYRLTRTGRFVSRSVVLDAIDEALRAEEQYAVLITEQLRDGTISLTEWRDEMRVMIKNVHLYAAAAARGGWDQLTQSDYGRVGQIVRQEYNFLEARAAAISSGATPLDGRVTNYARQYARGGIETYWVMDRLSAAAADKVFERNVLHPGEHCEDCIAATAQGPVPIGTLPPIGTRKCRHNCNCTLEYLTATEAAA